MRAFITGITGFAGSHLAEQLLDCGESVAGCSTSGRWRDGTVERLLREVQLLAWDLSFDAATEMSRTLRRFQPDVVYHLAAVSVPVDCGGVDPKPEAWNINVTGTGRLVNLLERLPTPPRLVLVSSCHVYAPVSIDDSVRSEDAPLGPATGYGKTKLAAEQLVLTAWDQQRLSAVIVRPFKHVGPRQSPRLMLPEWTIQLARPGDDPVRVINLDSYFDITDVRDVVRAYRLLAEHGQSGQIYNVGSGVSRRSGYVYQRLRELADCKRATTEVSPGIRQEPIADISRLQRSTGWKPEIPLDATLRDTLEFWRDRACSHGLHRPFRPVKKFKLDQYGRQKKRSAFAFHRFHELGHSGAIHC